MTALIRLTFTLPGECIGIFFIVVHIHHVRELCCLLTLSKAHLHCRNVMSSQSKKEESERQQTPSGSPSLTRVCFMGDGLTSISHVGICYICELVCRRPTRHFPILLDPP